MVDISSMLPKSRETFSSINHQSKKHSVSKNKGSQKRGFLKAQAKKGEKKSLRQRFFSLFKKKKPPSPKSASSTSQHVHQFENNAYNQYLPVFLDRNVPPEEKILTLLKATVFSDPLALGNKPWNALPPEEKQAAIFSQLGEILALKPEEFQAFLSTQDYADLRGAIHKEKSLLENDALYRAPLHEVTLEQVSMMALFCQTLEGVFPQAKKLPSDKDNLTFVHALDHSLSHLAFQYVKKTHVFPQDIREECSFMISQEMHKSLEERLKNDMEHYLQDHKVHHLQDAGTCLVLIANNLEEEHARMPNAGINVEEKMDQIIKKSLPLDHQKEWKGDQDFQAYLNDFQGVLETLIKDGKTSQEQKDVHQKTQKILTALQDNDPLQEKIPVSKNNKVSKEDITALKKYLPQKSQIMNEIGQEKIETICHQIYQKFIQENAFALPNDKMFYKTFTQTPNIDIDSSSKRDENNNTRQEIVGKFPFDHLKAYSGKKIPCDPEDTCLKFHATLLISPDGKHTIESLSYDNKIHLLPEAERRGNNLYLHPDAISYADTMGTGSKKERVALNLVTAFSIPPKDMTPEDLLMALHDYQEANIQEDGRPSGANKSDFCRNLLWQQGCSNMTNIKANLERCQPFYQKTREAHRIAEQSYKPGKAKKSFAITFNKKTKSNNVHEDFWDQRYEQTAQAYENFNMLLPKPLVLPDNVHKNDDRFKESYLKTVAGTISFSKNSLKKSLAEKMSTELKQVLETKDTQDKEYGYTNITSQFQVDVGRLDHILTLNNETLSHRSQSQSHNLMNSEQFIQAFEESVNKHIEQHNPEIAEEQKEKILRNVTGLCTQDYGINLLSEIKEKHSLPDIISDFMQLRHGVEPLSFIISADEKGDIIINATVKCRIQNLSAGLLSEEITQKDLNKKNENLKNYDLNKSSISYISKFKVPLDGSPWIMETASCEQTLFKKN